MNPPISQLITMPEGKTLEFKRDISDCRNVLKMSINLHPNELWPKLQPESGPSWDHVGTKSGPSRDQVISKQSTQSPTQSPTHLHKISSSQNVIKSVTKQVGEQVTEHVASTNHREHRDLAAEVESTAKVTAKVITYLGTCKT